MTGRRVLRRCLIALLLLPLLAACTDNETTADPTSTASALAAECAASVASLLGVTQRYLNGLETTKAGAGAAASPGPAPTPGETPSSDVVDEEEFARALKDIRTFASQKGCDPAAFQRDLAAGMRSLRTGGPVAQAVLLQLRAQSEPEPTSTGPLKPGDDVAAAVARAPSGATVRLAAGTFTLSETMALLRGITLVGAGRDATRLQSAATGGPLLVLTAERVTVRALTVRRTGNQPGPVVSAGPATTLVVTQARVSGARADRQGLGGVGILMSGGAGGQGGGVRRNSLTLSDSELLDNAVAGLVVAGEHRVDVRRTLVARSGQCGVCFLGTSDGVVRDSRFVDDAAGLVVAGDARPKLVRSTVTGGQVGVQALDRAAPEISAVTVTGTARAAMIWTAQARGRVDGNTCVRVAFGIVVGPKALPFLGSNSCQVARGRQ